MHFSYLYMWSRGLELNSAEVARDNKNLLYKLLWRKIPKRHFVRSITISYTLYCILYGKNNAVSRTHIHMLHRGCVELQIHLIGFAEKQKNELADVNGKAQGTVNM